MPWNKIVTADTVIQRLYEGLGLYNMVNRSYDGMVKQGATSVSRPKLAKLIVKKNTAVAEDSADRKKTHTDTTMVTSNLITYTVPILSQVVGQFESNDMLRTAYEASMVLALQEQFSADVIAAAQATTNVLDTKTADTLAWCDITKISKFFSQKKVPKDGRIIVVSAELEDQFWDIDVIKSQAGVNMQILSTGKFIQVLGMNFFISADVAKKSGKDNIVGIYGPGLAFILSRYAEVKECYSPTAMGDVIDLLSHAVAELDDPDFAVCVKLKAAA